jgi:predicted P-loop ATPase
MAPVRLVRVGASNFFVGQVMTKETDGQEPEWMDELIRDKQNKIKANLHNLVLFLTKASEWEGVLAWDEFAARVVIRKSPPWGKEKADTRWIDNHESLTRCWFQKQDINPSAGDTGKAVQNVARSNAFHPVREVFESLTWDGRLRTPTWLIDHFHAPDSAYIRAIGPRWLISSVARIYDPGCQADHVLVLEGPQGKQKSTALRTLAIRNAWFTDRLSHLQNKDAAMEIAGVLIIEIAEFDALTRAASSTAKSFITRREDRFRPPYGKHVISLPRQCVFAASINPPVGGYLKDPTGARRYWPVTCRDTVDVDGLEKARDQLWAEAVHRFKNGEPWWLETPKLEALATDEQAARFVVDQWEKPIREWLGDRIDIAVTEVLEKALGLSRGEWTQSSQNRVAKILTNMGFKQYRPRTKNGGREYRYRREPPPKKR